MHRWFFDIRGHGTKGILDGAQRSAILPRTMAGLASRYVTGAIGGGVFALLVSCSLTQSLSDYDRCGCTFPNGLGAGCEPDGTCRLASCNPGFANCNAIEADGCESKVDGDPNNCGTCGYVCPSDAPTCRASTCITADGCSGGARNCNGLSSDGCECKFAGAEAVCTPSSSGDAAQACTIGACLPGLANCNNSVADGCEVDVNTSASHCGRCGHSCEGAACIAGRCQPAPLATNQPGAGQIVFDGAWVYWTNYGSSGTPGSVVRVRLDGANLTTIASSQTNAWGVGEFGDDVYWTTSVGGASSTSILGRARKDGSQATTYKSLATIQGRLRGIAVDPASNYVFFALYDASSADGGAAKESGIYRVDRTATTPVPELLVSASKPNSIAIDGARVYFTSESAGGAPGTGSVYSAPKTGTLPVTATALATGLNRPRGVVIDDVNVYWANAGNSSNARDGSIERMAKAGASSSRVTLAGSLADSRELAIDSTHVYWTSYRDNTVSRIAKTAESGAVPEVIAQSTDSAPSAVLTPLAIAVDDKYVYWSNYTGNAIMRVVKP